MVTLQAAGGVPTAEALAEPRPCLGKRNLNVHQDGPATPLLARYPEK